MKPLREKKTLIKVGATLVLVAIISAGAVFAGNPDAKEASAEMKWGFKAARQGYWQEALMRFEHANELTPNQPRILNNVAVENVTHRTYLARTIFWRAPPLIADHFTYGYLNSMDFGVIFFQP